MVGHYTTIHMTTHSANPANPANLAVAYQQAAPSCTTCGGSHRGPICLSSTFVYKNVGCQQPVQTVQVVQPAPSCTTCGVFHRGPICWSPYTFVCKNTEY